MFITLINDCKSQNDIGRLKTRYSVLFPNSDITFVGVDSNLNILSTLEAAGNLVDILDAGMGRDGLIALNIAPRGQDKSEENGSSFCYFWYRKTLVSSTIIGYNLSLVKKLQLIKFVNLLQTKEALDFALNNKLINKQQKNFISKSQFRSFEFQPYILKWIWQGEILPVKKIPISKIPDPPPAIWLIDSFGNAKTTLLKEEIKSIKGLSLKKDQYLIKTNLGSFSYYEGLRNIPDGETAIYTGSSGIGKKRFLEIATQNKKGSAKKTLHLKVGDEIKLL